MAWNGFCAICEKKVSYYTIDTVTVNQERGTKLLCPTCWIKIRDPDRLKKPKAPTTIVQNTDVREEKHIIQQEPVGSEYVKVSGKDIKTVDSEFTEEVEKISDEE